MNKKELDYYYALYRAMSGIRMDADEEMAEDVEGRPEKEPENNSGGAGTHIPYGLCKAEGIDVPKGTKPSGAWKLLEGKTGVKAEEVFKKIKEKGSPKEAFTEAKVEASKENILPEQPEKEAPMAEEPEEATMGTGVQSDIPMASTGEVEKSSPKQSIDDIYSKVQSGEFDKKTGLKECEKYLDNMPEGSVINLVGKTIEKKNGKWDGTDSYGIALVVFANKEAGYDIQDIHEPDETIGGTENAVSKLSSKDLSQKIKDITSQPFDPYKALTDTESTVSDLKEAVQGAEDGVKIHLHKFQLAGMDDVEGTFTKSNNGWVSDDTGEFLTDEEVAEGIYFNHYYSGKEAFVVPQVNSVEEGKEYVKDFFNSGSQNKEEFANVISQMPDGVMLKGSFGNNYYKVGDNWASIYDEPLSSEEVFDKSSTYELLDKDDYVVSVDDINQILGGQEGYAKTFELDKMLNGMHYGDTVTDGHDIWFKSYGGFKCITDPDNSDKSGEHILGNMAKAIGVQTFQNPDASPVKVGDEFVSSKPASLEEFQPIIDNANHIGGWALGKYMQGLPAGITVKIGDDTYTNYGNGLWQSPYGYVITAQHVAYNIANGKEQGIQLGEVDLQKVSDDEMLLPGDIVVKKKPESVEDIQNTLNAVSKIGYINKDKFKGALDNVPEGTSIKIGSKVYKKSDDGWTHGKKSVFENEILAEASHQFVQYVKAPEVAKEGGKQTKKWLELKTKELSSKIAKMPDGDEKTALQNELDGYNAKLKDTNDKAVAKKTEKAKNDKIKSLEANKKNIQAEYEAYKQQHESDKESAKDKVFEGIWEEPVTVADYESKKDSIQAKKDYFQHKVNQYHQEWLSAMPGSHTEALAKEVEGKFQKLLDSVNEFEKLGKNSSEEEYQKKCESYEKKISHKDAQIEDVKNGGTGTIHIEGQTFDDDAYSQERLDNAMWAKTPASADKKLRKICREVWKSSAEEERQAIYDYTRSYHDTNDTLRGYKYGLSYSEKDYIGPENIDWSKCGDYQYYKSSEQIAQKVENVTNIIDKSSYDFDMWVQRGIDPNYAELFLFGKVGGNGSTLMSMSEEEIADKIGIGNGNTLTEYAFASCGTAKGKGFSEKNVILNVYCPAGTKMMYCEPFSHYGNGAKSPSWDGNSGQSTFGNESEILLQQGTEMRPTKVTKADGKIYIDVEVVAQHPVHPDNL